MRREERREEEGRSEEGRSEEEIKWKGEEEEAGDEGLGGRGCLRRLKEREEDEVK